ncbi:MAG TPA: GNAT family N-acetyltransferase [Candidatus Deferrimicrobium sp.]|nr:GNAT family N-acetyltransferase [Candidatus Deferrimicrobium sp.]
MSDDELEVRRLGSGDDADVMDAADLFDQPPRQPWVGSFLRDPTHHLLIASRAGRPVGFVTGVETTHPDKGTEMFVYELAVAPDERRKGVANALLAGLTAIARSRLCYGMWVLTDSDNVAALAAYRSAGATAESDQVMLTWDWSGTGG